MDLFGNTNHILKLFVEFLGSGQHLTRPSPERWLQIEKDFGANVYQDILYLLTKKEFPFEEARSHWFGIIDHQETLSRALGREVGFQVAVVDYFTSVHPLLGNIVFLDIKVLLQKERSVLLDELTGLYNNRFFNRVIRQELDHSKRYDQPFSILIVRVEQFEAFTQAHGRQAAEKVLSDLADLLLKHSRTIDHAIRYNDDEFAMVLPRCDNRQVLIAAQRFYNAINSHTFCGRETALPPGDLTVTIGTAGYPQDAKSELELVKKARNNLQEALDEKDRLASSSV